MKLFGFSLDNMFGTTSKRSIKHRGHHHVTHRQCNHRSHRNGHSNRHRHSNRTHYKKHMKGRTRKYKMKGG